jgi:hypothetical protein
MAGFLNALSFLAPVGESVGQTMGQFQQQSQQQSNRDAFGKALDNLGPNPEFDLMRQMWKSGASPEAISSVMGGPIGGALQKQYQQQRWNEFVGPEGIKSLTPDKIWEGVGRNIFTPDEAFKYQEDLLKMQAERDKLQQAGRIKTDPKFGTFLATKGITTQDQLDKLEQDPDAMKTLQPEYEQFAGLGAGSTKLIRDFDPNKGEEVWRYVPAHGPAGEIAGHVRPPVGGNPIAVLNSAEMGMHRLQDLMKPLGDSNVPMLIPAEMQKRGIKPSEQYAAVQDQIGQTFAAISTMIMRAGGFRNPQVAQEWMGTHIPKSTDSPALVNSKLKQWFTPGGLMDQYRVALGQNMLLIPTKGGGLTSGGPDPFAVPPTVPGGPAAAPPADLEDVD